MSPNRNLHGDKKPLTAIHGWGFNSAVWDDMGEQLQDQCRFTAIDLPGFGRCPMLEGEYTLPTLANRLIETTPKSGVLMGWSLGGMVALEMAHCYPEQIDGLVMVASSPRFTATQNWPHGVAPEILNVFSETVIEDHKAALLRFLFLQAGRIDLGRATVKKLKPLLFRYGSPDQKALEKGLILLRETDSRDILKTIQCPVLFILGERDNLLSPTVVEDLSILCPNCRIAVINGSAHAPFISHPLEFFQVLMSFLQDVYIHD